MLKGMSRGGLAKPQTTSRKMYNGGSLSSRAVSTSGPTGGRLVSRPKAVSGDTQIGCGQDADENGNCPEGMTNVGRLRNCPGLGDKCIKLGDDWDDDEQ